MQKKQSISSQLSDALALVGTLEAELATARDHSIARLSAESRLDDALTRIKGLETDLKLATAQKDAQCAARMEAEAQVEQIGQFLDALPNSVPRECEGANSWDRTRLTQVTRLGVWLASRHFPPHFTNNQGVN